MRRVFGVFVVLLVLSLLKHALLAAYAHPCADDFCYAWKSHGVGLWAWSVGEYHDWNGRYTSNLLMALGPLRNGPDFLLSYRAVPIALLLITLLAYRTFVRALTKRTLRAAEEWGAAVVLCALLVNGMPTLAEGFYWYTGAITYQLANALLLFLLASLLTFGQGRYLGGRAVHAVLNALLVVLIAGMDEQHLVLLCASFAVWCVWAVRRTQRAPWSLLIVALGAGAFVLAAPGNAVRGAFFPEAHRLFPSLALTARTTVRVLVQFIASPALLACSAVYVPVHLRLRERVPVLARGFGIRPLTAALALVALVALCVFPAYWSMGMLAQDRTLNVAYAFFLLLWSLGLSAVLEHPWGRWLRERPWNGTVRAALCAVVIAAMQCTGNGRAAWEDVLSGRARAYGEEMQFRYLLLTSSNGPVAPIPSNDPPLTLPHYEERHPDQHWMTQCEQRYFSLWPERPHAAVPCPGCSGH